MLNGLNIILVEDDEIMGGSLMQRLKLEGATVSWHKQTRTALGAIRTPRMPVDAVISDIRLPDGSGEELFTTLCQSTTPPPFLFVTGHGGIEQAVRLMKAGAIDYVAKPFEISVLLERLANLLAVGPVDDLPPVLGISPAARRIEDLTQKAAASDGAVLILGGPGTGKGLVARRIHEMSDRCAAPFVTVNLAREPDAAAALLKPGGSLERVGEGVLYLHALPLLPEAAQAGLLAMLESDFPARIIASCRKGATEIVARGGLGAELFFRLGMMEIAVPPLSDRPEDAVWLMARLFGAMNAHRAVPLDGISGLTEEAVRNHDWAGGGRELRARMVRGVANAAGPLLQPTDLFPDYIADGGPLRTLAEAREAAERRHIVTALERCDRQVGQAAKLLGVSRTTLWDKMQKYGLQREDR